MIKSEITREENRKEKKISSKYYEGAKINSDTLEPPGFIQARRGAKHSLTR